MVPCLHEGNIYIKRKLRVWRDQKCIALVGAKTPLTCAGCQFTPSQGSRCRSESGNLRKLGWTYRYGTVFAPGQYLYPMEATGMETPEMYSLLSVQKSVLVVRAVKLPCLKGVDVGPRMQTCVNLGGPIALVPSLQHGNIYMKRMIRVWRD